MEKILNYLKIIGYFISSVLILTFLIAIINYITPLSLKTLNIISTIILLIIFFIIGFKQGKMSNNKGWLCGIKNGFILCFTLLLISLIFFTKNIKLSLFLYYGILLLSTVFGSIIGINKKKEK